jgi:hypothetical protein
LKYIGWKNYQFWAWIAAIKALEAPYSLVVTLGITTWIWNRTRVEGVQGLGHFKLENQRKEEDFPHQIESNLN